MDALTHLIDTRGFFTRGEAIALGLRDRDIARGRREGTWHRFCHGYYAGRERWLGLTPEGQHLLRADAACHQMAGAVIPSHVTGALIHGVDIWGYPLDVVDVTRRDGGSGRCANGVRHHLGVVADDAVLDVGGRAVLPAARCAVEAATLGTPEQALVVFDSVLRAGVASYQELVAQYDAMDSWPQTQRLRVPADMADGRVGSVGESRLRWLLRCAGVPAPQLQYEVRDGDELVARCDFAWPELGIIIEFDGRAKYIRFVAPGLSPGDVVFAEKQREDRIREVTGFMVLRVTWADLERPHVLLERLDRAMRARRRAGLQPGA